MGALQTLQPTSNLLVVHFYESHHGGHHVETLFYLPIVIQRSDVRVHDKPNAAFAKRSFSDSRVSCLFFICHKLHLSRKEHMNSKSLCKSSILLVVGLRDEVYVRITQTFGLDSGPR
jgi:hypothetical protein